MDPMDSPSFTVLFVCTGNTCRSPLAEVLARKHAAERKLEGRVRILSAGTGAGEGWPASEGSATVASRHGLALSGHRSSPLTPELAMEADLVLGMTPSHVHVALQVAPEARTELLGAFALGREGVDGPPVPDPVGSPLEVYEETYHVLDELVGKSMDRIARLISES
jgi:protein-tyrosine-phosphatase